MPDYLLIATLPIPPSINEWYATDLYSGRRILSGSARAWKEDIFQYLDYARAPEPYAIHYLNVDMVQEIRRVYSLKGRSKAVLQAQDKHFSIDTVMVLKDERRDGDNAHKPLQDTLFDWFADKRDGERGVSFNDRRIISLSIKRLVDPTTFPHIEIVMKQTSVAWEAQELIRMSLRNVEEQAKQEQSFSQAMTARIEVVRDVSLQRTQSMPRVTRILPCEQPTEKMPKIRYMQPRMFD